MAYVYLLSYKSICLVTVEVTYMFLQILKTTELCKKEEIEDNKLVANPGGIEACKAGDICATKMTGMQTFRKMYTRILATQCTRVLCFCL